MADKPVKLKNRSHSPPRGFVVGAPHPAHKTQLAAKQAAATGKTGKDQTTAKAGGKDSGE